MFKPMLKFVVCIAFAAGSLAHAEIPSAKIDEIAKANKLSEKEGQALRASLGRLKWATQGGAAAIHPETRQQCERENIATGRLIGGDSDIASCGKPNMAVVPSNGGGTVCIDRFEFPNIACDYPITWVQANQAAEICEAEGKRLCDAHEWEGACANKPQPSDWLHPGNSARKKVWAYGDERDPGLCAFGQPKSPGCDAAIVANKNVAQACAPNTWPAGSFPQCAGPLGVYDQHGNAAEHMNLARSAKEAGSNGGSGVTEMKGSWFVFSKSPGKPVHEDDCLWRAPGWHRTPVASPASHANYHLGFRCCADVK